MLFKVFTSRPRGASLGWARFSRAALLLPALLLALAIPAGSAAAASQPRGGAKPDPELMLIEVYKALGTDNLHTAQEKAEALVTDYPNFRLGQLIYGDLLMMNTHVVTTLGDVPNAPEDKL